MSRAVTIRVHGIPRPKGSWRVVKGRFLPSNKHQAAWPQSVAQAALVEMQGRVPWVKKDLFVEARFCFLRPPGQILKRGGLSKNAPMAVAVAPDLDKLLRAAFDAMTGIVYDDDSRVVGLDTCTKTYASPGVPTGMALVIREATQAEINASKARYRELMRCELNGPSPLLERAND